MNETNKIPKIIHYVWLGGNELGELEKKCIESWKKFCPDWEIKRWDETNFDVNENQYCKEALENKKWAFASDYIRVKVLHDEGGVYLDTDVELVKPLDEFLDNKVFVGLEDEENIATCVIGAQKEQFIIAKLLDSYKERKFIINGKPDLITNVVLFSFLVKECENIKHFNNGFLKLKNITIYPKDFFSPIDFETKKITLTKNTHAIHRFAGTWVSKRTFLGKSKGMIIKFIKLMLGKKNVQRIREKRAQKRMKQRGQAK